jgi:hypothetical protein
MQIIKLSLLTPLVALALAACGGSVRDEGGSVPEVDDGIVLAQNEGRDHGDRGALEVDVMGIHWTRHEQGSRDARSGGRTSSPNMTFHGGKVMTAAVTKAIFWGPSWSDPVYAGDKITGMDAFYTGMSNSHYAATSSEYFGRNGKVGNAVTHQGNIIDTSVAGNGSSPLAILTEVCKQITAGNITVDAAGNGYYPVYTDVKRGTANYCAWHSAGTCGGKSVQFAFFFDLAGDPGCDPNDTTTGHSQALAAIANVSAHELSEARTDPGSPGGWYDSSGNENGDKCAWTFNAPAVAFSDGTSWKVQGEWSNAAYSSGKGYPNLNGQKGCLDGH